MSGVCALIPDPRVLERGFHDVTIVDMGDSPESSVSLDDLSLLRLQWPVTLEYGVVPEGLGYYVRTMGSGSSAICTAMWLRIIWIWASCGGARCLGVQCGRARHRTVWTMSGGVHAVPSDIMSASLEKFFPSWTVRHQIWVDALKPCHSGVSTDVLLLSDINLSLVHHYRVFKRGLPHCAFRRDCQTCLRVFVSQATALAQCDMASPVPASSVSTRHAPLRWSLSRPGRHGAPVVFVTNPSVSRLRP